MMILTLVPAIGTNGQDGATGSASPRFVVDVAVSARPETGALVAGELALSSTHANTAVHPVRLSNLQGRAGPIFEDLLASVEEVRFAFPRWRRRPFPVYFVEICDGCAPPSYGSVAGNLVDLQTLDGHGDVVCGDMEREGFDGVVVEDVPGIVLVMWGSTGKVGCVVGVCTGLQRATETWQWTSEPGMSLGRSKRSN